MPVGLERVAENRVTSQLLYTISSFPYSKVCVLLRRSILLYIACWQAISCPVQSVCICCTIDWSICQYNLSSLASGRQVLEPRKLFSFFLLAVLFLIFYFLFFLDSRNLIPFSPPKTLTGFSIIFFPPLLPSISSATAMVRHIIRPFPIIDPAVAFLNFSTAWGIGIAVLPFLDLSFVDSIQLFSLSRLVDSHTSTFRLAF